MANLWWIEPLKIVAAGIVGGLVSYLIAGRVSKRQRLDNLLGDLRLVVYETSTAATDYWAGRLTHADANVEQLQFRLETIWSEFKAVPARNNAQQCKIVDQSITLFAQTATGGSFGAIVKSPNQTAINDTRRRTGDLIKEIGTLRDKV